MSDAQQGRNSQPPKVLCPVCFSSEDLVRPRFELRDIVPRLFGYSPVYCLLCFCRIYVPAEEARRCDPWKWQGR